MPYDEDKPSPPWGILLAKLVVATCWLAACALAAATLLHGGKLPAVLAAAALLVLGPTMWLLLQARRLARADEAEAFAIMHGLAKGLLFAVAWPGAMLGGSVVSSLLIGAGEVNVSGMMQSAVIYLAILPPLAFAVSELAIFAQLTVFARKPEK